MPQNIFATMLFPPALAQAEQFYRGVFAGEPVISMKVRECSGLANHGQSVTPQRGRGARVPSKVAHPNAVHASPMTLQVDDAVVKHARLASLGVVIKTPPTDQLCRIRTITFADPTGQLWELSQPLNTDNKDVNPNDLINWIAANGKLTFEVLGTLAFAISGLIEAARKRLDIVGMAMVTGFTAFGGGTLRDILLDRRPFFWVQNELWLWVILAICALAMIFLRSRHLEVTERATQWPDALGLGIFASGGTYISLHSGMPPLVAVLMGVITAVFGGVLRDVVVNEIPRAFNDHQPYSVVAFLGGWVVVLLDALNVNDVLAIGAGAVVITGLRICAMTFGWRLPTWKV